MTSKTNDNNNNCSEDSCVTIFASSNDEEEDGEWMTMNEITSSQHKQYKELLQRVLVIEQNVQEMKTMLQGFLKNKPINNPPPLPPPPTTATTTTNSHFNNLKFTSIPFWFPPSTDAHVEHIRRTNFSLRTKRTIPFVPIHSHESSLTK